MTVHEKRYNKSAETKIEYAAPFNSTGDRVYYSENLSALGQIVLKIEQKLSWSIEYLKLEKTQFLTCMH